MKKENEGIIFYGCLNGRNIHKMPEVKRIGNIYGEDRGTGFAGNVWDKDGKNIYKRAKEGNGVIEWQK